LDLPRVNAAGLSINAGTVRVAPNGTAGGTSRVGNLTIAGGTTPTATLDVTNNAFVVDYTPGPDAEPFDTVKAQIVSAYNGGAWDGNGIATSHGNAAQFALGYGEASALTTVPAIFGSVDASAVLVRFTRYGDATLDGQVNLSDFNALAANFGSASAYWTDGDFNYDMLVNLADFNLLAGNFGLSAAGPGVTPDDWAALAAAVPEPGAAALVGLCGAWASRARGRRCRTLHLRAATR